ncbi:MAG: NUDIX domain-containing protein [Chitinophagaceae bacterium]|nr:MAG: NUDIX domain-containing protein [Chitinophagaceae bacterium]
MALTCSNFSATAVSFVVIRESILKKRSDLHCRGLNCMGKHRCMYIKIYFNNKPLFLTDSISPELEPYKHHDDAVFMDELSSPAINSMIHEMKTEKVHAGIFLHENVQALKHAFFKKFIVIQTGGGLVENDKNEYLMIFRRGKWDLPKGKLDEGETIEECTIREINEETKLVDLSIKKHLINTYHTYDENGKHILKENCWYLVHAAGDQRPEPQLEEDITDVKWVSGDNLGTYIQNTMPSIIDVLSEAGLIN